MELLEHFLMGRLGQPERCEDAWTATPDFACVIDGATSKGDLVFGRHTSGKMASLLLKEALRHLPAESSCQEAVEFFTNGLAEFYKEHHLYSAVMEKPWDRLAASMAIYSNARREVWLIGDCQCLVDGQHHQIPKVFDEMLSGMRASYLEAALKTGITPESVMENDIGRDFIYPMLRTQSQYQNPSAAHPFAYALLDGFAVYEAGIKVISVPPNAEVVLASDGYPRLFNNLDETEAYLKHILEEDPLCFRLHKATKCLMKNSISFDDRVYLKLHV